MSVKGCTGIWIDDEGLRAQARPATSNPWETSMKRLLLAAVALGTVLVGPAPAMETHNIIKASAIRWSPAPPQLPKGAQVAVVYGDPGKEGLYIILARMPDGYAIPAHWHNQVENVTVLSGTFNVGMGGKLNFRRSGW